MKVKNTSIAALLVFALSCDKEDNNAVPTQTSLLTLTVDASYNTDNSDNWIIIHDENGALLASESFETNQQLDIVTDKPVQGKIMVTQLDYRTESNGKKFYFAKSHGNIEKGNQIFLRGGSSNKPVRETGKLNISISDVGFHDFSWLSNPVSSYSSTSWDGGTSIVGLQTSTYENFSKYLVVISDGNSLRYKVLKDTKPNELYSFSFYDMDPFDKKVTFSFPPSNNILLDISGSEPDATVTPNAFTVMFRYHSDTRSTVDAGYLNFLSNFRTNLSLGYSGHSYQYSNIGSIPDGNIVWPQQSDFSITKTSLEDFSATASKPYVWRSSSWRNLDPSGQVSVIWNIASSSDRQSFNELPNEITKIHPALSFKKLNHSGTTFYTQSPAYNSIVGKNFGTEAEPAGVRLAITIQTK